MTASNGNGPLLQVVDVSKSFGGLAALSKVNIQVFPGEILGLIGPNGAGKTTLFNVVAGNILQEEGQILFHGEDLGRRKSFRRCRMGLARTYQNSKPFLDFTVDQNLMVALRYGRQKDALSTKELRDKGTEILAFLGLEDRRHSLASNLTLVDRKLLEIARALATSPTLLLLDEVLSGLNPAELTAAVPLIKEITTRFGVTIVWIEHIMKALLSICDRLVVLNYGVKLTEGSPNKVMRDREVIEAYLGRAGSRFAQKKTSTVDV